MFNGAIKIVIKENGVKHNEIQLENLEFSHISADDIFFNRGDTIIINLIIISVQLK